MEGGHEEVTRAVTREDAPGAVGTMRRRRESYEQEPCVRISKAGDGTSPIGVVAMGAFLVARNPVTVLSKPRAAFARHDRVAEV